MSSPVRNPLIRDREVAFVLYEQLDIERLCRLPAFRDLDRDVFDAVLQSSRRLAREVLYPAFAEMDREPPVLRDGAVTVHRRMREEIYPRLVELGLSSASRPESVGGQGLPYLLSAVAATYIMAANGSAYSYTGLTTGAAHLIEAFGSDDLKERFMKPMYAGTWTGTMALTEPQAGSSLADVQSTATPTEHGHYLIRGSKIFISGGDHDVAENIVHLLLARIEGAPAGTRGISLFAVPKRRSEGDALVPNDVHAAGMVHKIGWKALPSMVMSYGEADDCHGWLVGEPNRGLANMFQLMNEARIMVGFQATATAAVAYYESLNYAQTRLQGRPAGAKDPTRPPVPIIEHSDVRRMLMRQKAIVEGSFALLSRTALAFDLAHHAEDDDMRERERMLLDVLTPIAKSFPAEKGYESNALAVQIHGGYGYSSEYMVEAWLREQKLNSIHEGTTGIQSLDLLGRRIMAGGGAGMRALASAVGETITRARTAEVQADWLDTLTHSLGAVADLTAELGQRGLSGEIGGMLRHSFDYLDLVSTLAIGWQWIDQAATIHEGRQRASNDGTTVAPETEEFYRGKLAAAQYWFANEMTRIPMLIDRCRTGDDAYDRMQPGWF